MLDFLGGLVSSGLSFVNGMMNRQNQNSINAANMAENEMFAKNAVTWKEQDATNGEKLTGINRLVGLGINPSAGPATAVATNDDSTAKAGQDIQRAMTAYADRNDKKALLEGELLRAKIRNTDAMTDAQRAETASRVARTFASPGSPPGLANRPGSEKPAYQKYSSWPYSLLSHDAANTQFGPTSFVTGAELLPGLLWEQGKGTYAHVAPYVARAYHNVTNPDVTLSGSPPSVGDMVD